MVAVNLDKFKQIKKDASALKFTTSEDIYDKFNRLINSMSEIPNSTDKYIINDVLFLRDLSYEFKTLNLNDLFMPYKGNINKDVLNFEQLRKCFDDYIPDEFVLAQTGRIKKPSIDIIIDDYIAIQNDEEIETFNKYFKLNISNKTPYDDNDLFTTLSNTGLSNINLADENSNTVIFNHPIKGKIKGYLDETDFELDFKPADFERVVNYLNNLDNIKPWLTDGLFTRENLEQGFINFKGYDEYDLVECWSNCLNYGFTESNIDDYIELLNN